MPFDFTFSSPSEFEGPLPPAVDVAIIGGGIAGIMTAWFLARQGQKILLCDKGRLAAEQSSRDWGWIRQQGRDIGELPIMIEALGHWQALSQQIGPELGFRQRGILYTAKTNKDLERQEAWLKTTKGYDVDTRMLSPSQVAEQLGGCAASFAGGMMTPSDASAEPWAAVPAIARALARNPNVCFRERTAVRRLDVSAGRVAGIVTEAGRVQADRVVLTGGAWSALFLAAHDVRIPQLSVRATVAATRPMDMDLPVGATSEGTLAFRKRADGGFTLAPSFFHELFIGPDAFRHLRPYLPMIWNDGVNTKYKLAAPVGYPDAWRTPRAWPGDQPSPFEAMRTLNPAPNSNKVRQMVHRFSELFPGAGDVQLQASWAGMIDVMPDVVPILDHVPQLPGLTLATGLSGHGFGIGPGIGRVMADLTMGREVGHDLSPFAFDRFGKSRGTRTDLL